MRCGGASGCNHGIWVQKRREIQKRVVREQDRMPDFGGEFTYEMRRYPAMAPRYCNRIPKRLMAADYLLQRKPDQAQTAL